MTIHFVLARVLVRPTGKLDFRADVALNQLAGQQTPGVLRPDRLLDQSMQ